MFFDRCHPSEEGVPLPARPRQDAETLAAAAGLPQGLRHEHGNGDASTGRFLHFTGQSVQNVLGYLPLLHVNSKMDFLKTHQKATSSSPWLSLSVNVFKFFYFWIPKIPVCRMVILFSLETFCLQCCCCYHRLIYVFIHLWVIWVFTPILTTQHCTTLNSYWNSRTSVWRPFVGSLWLKKFLDTNWSGNKKAFQQDAYGPLFLVPGDMMSLPVWSQRGVLHYPPPRKQTNACETLPSHNLALRAVIREKSSSTRTPTSSMSWIIYIAGHEFKDSDSKPDQWKLHCTMQNISHCTDLDSDPYLFSDPHLLLYPFLATDIRTQIGIRVRVWQCKWAVILLVMFISKCLGGILVLYVGLQLFGTSGDIYPKFPAYEGWCVCDCICSLT